MTYIGIDPGAKGALAILDGDMAYAIPFDERKYIDHLQSIDPSKAVVCLEHVGSRSGQGVKSTFSFGRNFGFIQGVLSTLQISCQLVSPQKWKKEFSVTSDKNTAIMVCKRFFPGVSLLPTERCRKENDGMAEALLLAEYARRNFTR